MRKGRQFEQLIARIESSLAGKNIFVKTPAYLPDIDTNEPREVDVAITSKIGSTNILVVLECRDHSRVQNAIWIEQLIQKQRSVGANKLIAVSRSGFNKKALKKAEIHGIETRTYQSVNVDELEDWVTGIDLIISDCRYVSLGGNIKCHANVGTDPNEININWHNENGLPAPVFQMPKITRPFNILSLFSLLYYETFNRSYLDGDLTKGKELWVEKVFAPDQLYCISDHGMVAVEYAKIGFFITLFDVDMTIDTVNDYAGKDSNIARLVSWKGDISLDSKAIPIEVQATYSNPDHDS